MASREDARRFLERLLGPMGEEQLTAEALDEIADVLTRLQVAEDALFQLSAAARNLELALGAVSMFMPRGARGSLLKINEVLGRMGNYSRRAVDGGARRG